MIVLSIVQFLPPTDTHKHTQVIFRGSNNCIFLILGLKSFDNNECLKSRTCTSPNAVFIVLRLKYATSSHSAFYCSHFQFLLICVNL